MKSKKALKLFIGVSLAGIILYIALGLKSTQSGDDAGTRLEVDGERMTHYTYDKENRRAMELKCSMAVREGNDKMVMKDIEGVIFKKGRMNKDVRVFGQDGFVANNSHNFFVENDARVVSDDFTIQSQNFFLKDQATMSTGKKVIYETDKLKGIAAKGMEFYLKLNVLKFFKTRGNFTRDDRKFKFKTDILWVIDEENLIVLEKRTVIREGESVLRSGWVSLKFTDNFKRIVESASQVNSYLFTENLEKQQSREITADNITSFYNETGKLTQIRIMQNAEVSLKSESAHTMIASEMIDMMFDPETGNATKISIPGPGQIESTGKTDFRVIGENIEADYNDKGELTACKSQVGTEFIIDEYRGVSDVLTYNIKKNLIALKGPQAQVITRDNTFNSARFTIDTDKKILASGGEVRSVIILNKQNVLFSPAPIFVNADTFTIFEKENKFNYKRRVNLVQDDIGLRAVSLAIVNENRIEAVGKVTLSFKSDEKEIVIKGDRVIFNPAEKQIEISGKAAIKSDENLVRAGRFFLLFSDTNEITKIVGEDDITFTKDDIFGAAGKVDWLFKEDTMVLKELPQIVKKNGGTTFGKELKINLKTNKITIISSGSSRTQTIIK